MPTPHNWKTKYKANKPKRQRAALRKVRLSAPITADRISTFVKHLIAVSFESGSECWIYLGSTSTTTLPEVKFKTTAYANIKFNGEVVGPHQFALAASRGITLADLAGFDTHHSPEFGRCLGYRCCNPDHLEQQTKRDNRAGRGDNGSLVRFQSKAVREVLGVPASERRPAELRTTTGAGSRRRFLAGLPFLIRGGVFVGVAESEA